MAAPSTQQLIDDTLAAIHAVTTLGQAYTLLDGTSVTHASLATLHESLSRLEARQARETAGSRQMKVSFGRLN